MKIYLVGMPASGKSTVGRVLAKKINYKFIDLDGEVEKQGLMFANDLIDRYGIDKFRELETQALKNISGNNLVIACGGGVVENLNNKAYMDGVIIYLDVDNEEIDKRLKTDYERPLLREKTVEQLYNERFLKYQHFADHIISNNETTEKAVKAIIEKIGV